MTVCAAAKSVTGSRLLSQPLRMYTWPALHVAWLSDPGGHVPAAGTALGAFTASRARGAFSGSTRTPAAACSGGRPRCRTSCSGSRHSGKVCVGSGPKERELKPVLCQVHWDFSTSIAWVHDTMSTCRSRLSDRYRDKVFAGVRSCSSAAQVGCRGRAHRSDCLSGFRHRVWYTVKQQQSGRLPVPRPRLQQFRSRSGLFKAEAASRWRLSV
jgi:hypothetical protein